MPIPTPRPDETEDDFLSRCMGNDTMVNEYPDEEQRYAICQGQLELSHDERITQIRDHLKKIIRIMRNMKQ